MRRALIATLLLLTACGTGVDQRPLGTPGTTASPSPSVAPSVAPSSAAPCQTEAGGADDAAMLLIDVRVSETRIAFEFKPREGQPAKIPGYKIARATPPLLQDGSGEPIEVQGNAFVSAVMQASGVDLSNEYKPVYTGPKSITKPATSQIREAKQGGDFENVLTWYIGTRTSVCWKVTEFHNPEKIVIDFPG